MVRKLKISNPAAQSVRVTIPKFIVQEFKLVDGQEVEVYMKGSKIIIDTVLRKDKEEN